MSSHANVAGIIEPIRFSSPFMVKSTTRVSALGTRSSIQRCFPSNGWSVMMVNPSYRYKNPAPDSDRLPA